MMKKNILVLLFLSSVLLFSCGKKTVIEGVVSEADSCKLLVENFNAGNPIALENTILGKNGKFSFKVPALDTTEIYNLILDSTKVIRLVVNSEEKITVKTTKANFGKEYEVLGSQESKLLQEAESRLWQTRSGMDKLREQYKFATTEEEKAELEKKYQELFAKHHDYLRHFVFDNAHSLVAYLALYQKIDAQNFVFGNINDDKYVRAVAQKMKMKNPNSPYFSLLLKELKQRNAEKQNAQVSAMLQEMKNSYPELNLEDVQGEKISLKGLSAKYVLLCFGVLNEAAKANFSATYNKYHSRGLEIYFVDENPNVEVWKQAVADLQTPWVNVHDTRGFGVAVYNVQKIPANYIIDIDGTIEGKDLFGRYLTEKLNKLL